MPPFSPLIDQAIELAAEWHDQTYRKSRWRPTQYDAPAEHLHRVPVMAHVTAVAMSVARAGWDEEPVAAAFLHDLLEDGNQYGSTFSYAQLAETMGTRVADLVQGVTERKRDETGAWRRWDDRKRDYIEALRNGLPGSVAISLADKTHNFWTMNQALALGIDIFSDAPGRKGLSAGPERQSWYVHSVLDASLGHEDARLEPLRAQLRDEIERFEALIAEQA
ncbi:MAG: HD domain-containing protein [Bacteroidota bacterium]